MDRSMLLDDTLLERARIEDTLVMAAAWDDDDGDDWEERAWEKSDDDES